MTSPRPTDCQFWGPGKEERINPTSFQGAQMACLRAARPIPPPAEHQGGGSVSRGWVIRFLTLLAEKP